MEVGTTFIAFGVWCLVALIGSLVATFILRFMSCSNDSCQASYDKGLKSLAGAGTGAGVGVGVGAQTEEREVKIPTSESENQKKEAKSIELSNEENHLSSEIHTEEREANESHILGNETTADSPMALHMNDGDMAHQCFLKQQIYEIQQQQQQEQEMELPNENYPYLLPPRRKDDPRRLTVVLDLDETLVRSCEEDDVPVELEFAASMGTLQRLEISCEDPSGGPPERIMSFLRPGVFQFLRQLSAFAEVVVFTAGDPEYASPLVAYLDPERKTFIGSLYRNSTVKTVFHDHVKDLSCLGRDPRHTVLVDNNPFSFLFQPDNGVLCEPFFGDPSDQHLLQVIMPLLKLLACVNDVRPILRRRFNLAAWRSNLVWNQALAFSQRS